MSTISNFVIAAAGFLLSVIFVFLPTPATAVPTDVPPVCPSPCPAIPPPQPTLFCGSYCAGSVTTVRQFDPEKELCVDWYSYPCEPYACDATGRTCGASCTSDAQCSAGARCVTDSYACTTAPLPATCVDETHARDPSGDVYDCFPYKCRAARCLQSCSLSVDCQTGYVCDPNVKICVYAYD